MYIKRDIEPELEQLARTYPVVVITGPRQSGKTTVVKHCFAKPYCNLEDPEMRQLAALDPKGFLKNYPEGAIFDEVQYVPELCSYIQVIVDETQANGQFILSGSQQFELVSTITQSLAGRAAMVELLPLSINELKQYKLMANTDALLLHGFYPRIHTQNQDPTKAYKNYYKTYIERDLRQLIAIKDTHQFEKFVRLCAGRIGNVFVASQLATEVGVSVKTIQSWLSILEASYIVLLLQPYHRNIKKRVVKSPKLYFYDVGLASYLLNIESITHMARDPLRGALFENMIVLDLVKTQYNKGVSHNMYYYLDQHKNEVDVILQHDGEVITIEIKSSQTFHSSFIKGLTYIRSVLVDKIKQECVVYAGDNTLEVDQIKVRGYRELSLDALLVK